MSERLDLSSLRNAVASLEDGIAVVSDAGWFNAQSKPVQNTLIAGVIQNFEFVYELSAKMIKRQVEADAANPAEVDELSFRDLLRTAAERGLIADVDVWFRYRQLRGVTSQTYDHERARQVYAGTRGFIGDARALLAALEARNG